MKDYGVIPFCIRLSGLMRARKMTAYRLAKLTGLSHAALMSIIKGTTKDPRPDNLLKIAEALDLSLGELIEGTELEPDVLPDDSCGTSPLQEPLEEAQKTSLEELVNLDQSNGLNPLRGNSLLLEPVPPNFGGSNFAVIRMPHALMAPEIRVGDWVFIDLNVPKLGSEGIDALCDKNPYLSPESLDDGTLIAAEIEVVEGTNIAVIGRKLISPDGTIRVSFNNTPVETAPRIKKLLGRVAGVTRAYIKSNREENELFA